MSLKDYSILHSIISLPKPTYLMGLHTRAEDYVIRRINDLNIVKENKQISFDIKPIEKPIEVQHLTISYNSKVRRTKRTQAIQQAFGISPDNINDIVVKDFSITIEPGEIIFITGPSGAGKTTLLNVLKNCNNATFNYRDNVCIPKNFLPGSFESLNSSKALIELIGSQNIGSALFLMGLVGLSDAFIYLKKFDELSKGQQYRALLAVLIASKCNVWFIDEFCSNLDPITANIISDNLRKIAKRFKATIIVAAPNFEMFIQSLKPDRVILLTSAWKYLISDGKQFLEMIPKKANWNSNPPILAISKDMYNKIYRGQSNFLICQITDPIQPGFVILKNEDNILEASVKRVLQKRFCEFSDFEARDYGYQNKKHLLNYTLCLYPNIKKYSKVALIEVDIS